MLFDSFHDLARVATISLLAYGSLITVLRFAGKRALSKLNAFDLVVTVALGSTLATVLLSKDIAYLEGALAFGMLAGLQWIVSSLSVAWPLFRKLVRSRPRLLVENGEYRPKAMATERITKFEVQAAMRSAGIGRVEEVDAVVLESDGSLSVISNSAGPLTVIDDVLR